MKILNWLIQQFIFKNDLLYQQLKKSSLKVCNSIYSSTNAIIVVLHLLTYWGWDNVEKKHMII